MQSASAFYRKGKCIFIEPTSMRIFTTLTIIANITPGGDFPKWGAWAFTQGGTAKRQILFSSCLSMLTITSHRFNCIIIIIVVVDFHTR